MAILCKKLSTVPMLSEFIQLLKPNDVVTLCKLSGSFPFFFFPSFSFLSLFTLKYIEKSL